ncbi:20155_t:CDS:2 [Gigaspora margarita]|uniref:20155_t:CDS:1 n=1 Tax=Gigaspora margarita TaxID=4874 RepID=A0ABN7USH8_GIGMA|nr:20155_t:CDS:2 [Gigaspora margarita]
MPTATSTTTPTFVPIANPLKLNLTFERSLMQWSFPLQVGTPPQTLKIAIDTTYNLLWMVSELCMNLFGNACGNLTNFFNTSLSNTTTGDYDEFTIKYIDGSELVCIWANDTTIINNQTFEQMQIGLPKDIKGNENITISNTNAGQLGLKAYENNQTIGIALSTKSEDLGNGGSITLGGLDLGYILGNDAANIIYQPLPELANPNQEFMFNLVNVYINYVQIGINGLISFNSEIQDIQLDDTSALKISFVLPGGNYSNGVVMVDCNIPAILHLSFGIADQKWRIPSNAIIKGSINGTDKCESIFTGGANGSWVFGSAFIKTQAEIWIQLPTLIPNDIKCLLITDSDGNVQSISEDVYVDPNEYFKIPNYVAIQGFSYKFAFYSGPPNDGSSCSGNFLVETTYLMAVITNDPWLIGRNQYSVQGIKVQVSEKETNLGMLVLYNNNYVYKFETYAIDKRYADGSCDACENNLIPTMAGSPWTITWMGSCDIQCA